MPQFLPTRSGFSAVADEMQQVLLERALAAKQAEAEAYKRKQDELKFGLDARETANREAQTGIDRESLGLRSRQLDDAESQRQELLRLANGTTPTTFKAASLPHGAGVNPLIRLGRVDVSPSMAPAAAKEFAPGITPERSSALRAQAAGANVPATAFDPEVSKPSTRGPVHVTNALGANGKPVDRFIDPETGKTLYEVPKFQDQTSGPVGRFSTVSGVGPDGKPQIFRMNSLTGMLEPTGVQSAAASKPPTGEQRVVFDYYRRADAAVKDMEEVEGKLTASDVAIIQNSPLPDILNNSMLSDAGRRYANALRAYTTAKLRRESGAAISTGEFKNEARLIGIQTHDDPATIEQKRRNRRSVIEGFASQAGPAYEEYFGRPFGKSGDTKRRTFKRVNGKLVETTNAN